MKFGKGGRLVLASAVSIALLLGMSACGGGTIGYLWVTAARTSTNTPGNVINAYKIDDYTGNLTEVVNAPFPAGGGPNTGAPVNAVVLPGGRFLYTVNQNEPTNSVVQFSVGGDGILAYQQGYGSVGATPVWMDQGQGYLYVLDNVSPARTNGVAPPCVSPVVTTNTAPCGSVEVFAITADTGLLTPILNTTIKVGGVGINYFPVGPNPTRLKYVSGTGLIVLNGDGTITSFGIGGGGQLTTSANSTQVIDSSATIKFTSITTGGSYVYLTDGTNDQIFQYTYSNGVLQPISGSPYANLVTNTTPVWTFTASDSATNTYLYVVNSGSTLPTGATGTISVFSVQSDGRLSPLGGLNNQFKTGGFPTCMINDPSNKYVYTSNGDGTVTGFQRRQNIGDLTDLQRGSTFTAAGKPTCLVMSGITS